MIILGPLRQRELAAEAPLRIFTTPPPFFLFLFNFTNSVTNSPPDTIERVIKLNAKLINDLEQTQHLSKSVQRYI